MPQIESPKELNLVGHQLHQELLGQHPSAPARIAELFLPLITRHLENRFSYIADPHLIYTAVGDAMLSYLNRPQQFNPEKAGLYTYLCMSAAGDLKNMLKQTTKDISMLELQKSVENNDADAEYEIELQDDFDLVNYLLSMDSPLWLRIQQVIPDPLDQEILLLIMDEVRETARYTELLGIQSLSVEEQTQEVKRHKDRIKKKLQRSIDKSDLKQVEDK